MAICTLEGGLDQDCLTILFKHHSDLCWNVAFLPIHPPPTTTLLLLPTLRPLARDEARDSLPPLSCPALYQGVLSRTLTGKRLLGPRTKRGREWRRQPGWERAGACRGSVLCGRGGSARPPHRWEHSHTALVRKRVPASLAMPGPDPPVIRKKRHMTSTWMKKRPETVESVT